MENSRAPGAEMSVLAALAILGAVVGAALAGGGAGKSLQTFIVYQGPAPKLVAGDEVKLAKYDMFSFNRNRYDQINGDTYGEVRAINPDILIFNYQQGPDTWTGWYQGDWSMDSEPAVELNTISRYSNPRGHSMGNLDSDNPGFFLLNSSGQRIHTYGKSHRWLLDFGSPDFQAYWVEATITDVVDQPWCPDGVFVDNCMPTWASYFSERPAKYPTDATYTPAMHGFHTALAAGLHARGILLWTNTDHVDSSAGYNAWLALDADPNHPDFINSEGAFCHGWGGGCTFYGETKWTRQVNVMGDMANAGAAIFSHVNMSEGASGTDNYGKALTYWDALWYAIGSFLVGQNEVRGTDMFYFSNKVDAYYKLYWYDEYERIDIGAAVGTYTKTVHGGRNIYWREYERGYVYVNPTSGNVSSIALPEACKQLSHATINDDPATFADVTSIALDSHRAAILVKSSSLTAPQVVARHVFYNNSAFDAHDPLAGPADDGAIAADKTALAPAQTASFANYTSYLRGINGVMVDVDGLPGVPTLADFTFKVGNDSNPAGWSAGPAPSSVTVRLGAGVGGSDRISIIFPDGAVANTWLEVTVLPTGATGLAAGDVFYFGNAVGETGNSPADAEVTPTDVIGVRENPHTAQDPADILDPHDFDRDRNVDMTDQTIAHDNGTNSNTALQLITATVAP